MTSYILSSVTKGEAENKRQTSDVLYVCVCTQVSDRSPSQCSTVVRPFIIRGFIFYYHIMTGYDRAPPPKLSTMSTRTHNTHTHALCHTPIHIIHQSLTKKFLVNSQISPSPPPPPPPQKRNDSMKDSFYL